MESTGDEQDLPVLKGRVPEAKTSSDTGVVKPCSSISEYVGISSLSSLESFFGFCLGLEKSKPPAASEAFKFETRLLFPPFLISFPLFGIPNDRMSGALAFLVFDCNPFVFKALCAGIGVNGLGPAFDVDVVE